MSVRAIACVDASEPGDDADLPPLPTSGKRVYAISFDLDVETLRATYPGDVWRRGYADIRRILEAAGFVNQQGSVYFGGERINAVTCVLAAERLARELPWFAASVRDIRMLRIEEFNDLAPVVAAR